MTQILDRMNAGEGGAADELLPLVYEELHGLAEGIFRRRHAGHTLQPTALVHEAYLRLVGGADRAWAGRGHFYAVAAKAMRQILINHAERKSAAKRGGGRERITLDDAVTPVEGGPIDVLALEHALRDLERLDERQGRVVELRFFGGLTVDECAETLGVSPRTIELDWRMARMQLRRMIGES